MLDEREIVTSREVENAGQLYPTSVLIVLLKFVTGDLSSAYYDPRLSNILD
jgi:hypothetical protein